MKAGCGPLQTVTVIPVTVVVVAVVISATVTVTVVLAFTVTIEAASSEGEYQSRPRSCARRDPFQKGRRRISTIDFSNSCSVTVIFLQ